MANRTREPSRGRVSHHTRANTANATAAAGCARNTPANAGITATVRPVNSSAAVAGIAATASRYGREAVIISEPVTSGSAIDATAAAGAAMADHRGPATTHARNAAPAGNSTIGATAPNTLPCRIGSPGTSEPNACQADG